MRRFYTQNACSLKILWEYTALDSLLCLKNGGAPCCVLIPAAVGPPRVIRGGLPTSVLSEGEARALCVLGCSCNQNLNAIRAVMHYSGNKEKS